MSNNQKNESSSRKVGTDQKLRNGEEPVDPDSEGTQAPEVEPQPEDRPDLDWTDHED